MDDIELYGMDSFSPHNTNSANRSANQFARVTANRYLRGTHDRRPPIEVAVEIFDRFIGGTATTLTAENRDEFSRNLREELRRLPDFAVFPHSGEPFSSYRKELHKQVMAPLTSEPSRSRGSRPPNRNSFNGNGAALLSMAMKLAGKLPHELTYDDVMRASHYEGATISNSISAVFAAYKVDQYIWAHKRIETDRAGFADLMAEYRSEYPAPWDTLREILFEMRDAAGDDGLFDFEFSDPDSYELNLDNYEQFSFKAEMTNRTTGAQYELESLSSGEKVLMALCLTSFNQYLGRRRPKLLLLDELDAVLHPSMVAALVTNLKSLFVRHGTKVLMTSHSAMTVAALEEADIFRVVRIDGGVNVSRTTKSEAITELSEGLATVDAGLRIAAYDEAKVTILSEGNNTAHLRKWVQLTFPQNVHVFDELAQHRSASQLLAYGRLLGRMNTNTHFVIVWDCDAAAEADTLRRELPSAAKVTPFALRRRQDNTVVRNGIENSYDEDILMPFVISKVDNDGRLLGREFPSSGKAKFARHVFQHGTAEYFTHFHDLHAIVSGLLG